MIVLQKRTDVISFQLALLISLALGAAGGIAIYRYLVLPHSPPMGWRFDPLIDGVVTRDGSPATLRTLLKEKARRAELRE